MDKTFYMENRRALYERIEDDALAVVYSGSAPRRTNDEYYPFFADRSFLYLTGVDQAGAILMGEGEGSDALYIPPPDERWERWNGERVKACAAADISGADSIKYTDEFLRDFDRKIGTGAYTAVYLPLFKYTADESDNAAYGLARYVKDRYPHIVIKDLMPHIKALRLIKKPCEIAAMRKAEALTRDGIVAMMRAARPGMMEYELRAEFDYALMKQGVAPGFPAIISAGKNNFCIHYHGRGGAALDGDMVLNDVGAVHDNIVTDVSRGWPVNGRFNDRQRALYQCAFDTCTHIFGLIKPGMPMGDVDSIIRKYNYERLKDIGLCKSWDDIGTYMWHGGAHHVGFDVHDVVGITNDTPLAPGMVFCVDVGIYVEDWGIGFRLEDNCLVTENGCENLSAAIPRSIDEIEAVVGKG